jgi:paraquat-inducible protein B
MEPAEPAEAAARPLPEPVLARQNRLRLSLVWVVPIVAVIVGVALVVRSLLQAGPEVSIEFRSAEGIEPGRTEVRFKEVVVGRVKQVRLGPDRRKVLVTASLDKSVESIAVDDTRFWVVRPRVNTGGVSGLGTLLSGTYIGVDAGESQQSRREFVGLDGPPLVLRGEPGRSFVLQADDLGSLDVGAPVYHRRVRVGRVVGYTLANDGKTIDVRVFVEAPFEHLVTNRTRFWEASGFDVTLASSGLTVNTQSLLSLLAGGLAFGTRPGAEPGPAADSGHRFRLHATERVAMGTDDGQPMRVRMVFNQSLRGLDEGAPLDLLGVEIGVVRRVRLQHDAARAVPVEVIADIYPLRLGRLGERLADRRGQRDDRQMLKQLVERGLRAQVRTANLLTGSLYIAFDLVPKASHVPFDATAEVPTLPTVPGALADVQPQIADIVARLSKVRFDAIGGELETALKSVSTMTVSLQSTLVAAEATMQKLTPEAQAALVDVRQTLVSVQQTLASAQQTLRSAEANLTDSGAPLQRGVGQTLIEVQRAAQALRVMADYLQRHPETLLRGKPEDTLPPSGGAR